MPLPYDWGVTEEERTRPLPCDALLAPPFRVYHRAVDVDAPAGVAFRWLCQLRVAPYSYDVIDNRGRRSPRRLVPFPAGVGRGRGGGFGVEWGARCSS